MYKLLGNRCRMKERKGVTGYNTLPKRIAEKVHSFYTRDDNSRLDTGIKQTKTHKKSKRQRRILLYDLKTLHKKFHFEGKTKPSYSTFCKLRPFFVVFPRHSDRNTCMCKICNNTELMVDALNSLRTDLRESPISCLHQSVCSVNNEKCMFGKCNVCKDRTINLDKINNGKEITWYEWRTTRELRDIKKGKECVKKGIYVTSKEVPKGTADQLVDKLNVQLRRYSAHNYKLNTQYTYYSKRKSSLSTDECM